MVETEKIFITNNDIKLEAEYFQSSSNKTFGILLCHPHPQFGGTMLNNIISGVFYKFLNNNLSCLRFNYRGIGMSEGDSSDGTGEINDVKACIDFLINNKGLEKILICGYSYGAAIGCSAVNYSDKVVGFVAISFMWYLMGGSLKKQSQTEKPKLFVQGNIDIINNYKKFNSHYEYFNEPKLKAIIDGANHFYRGYEERVANEVLKFYESLNL